MVPVRHPALKAQDDIYALSQTNQQLAQDNDSLNAQNRQVMNEAAEMRSIMENPNVDANIGPMNDVDRSDRMNPVEALYDGIAQGATMQDLADLGMVEPALQEMQNQGLSPEDQENIMNELQQLAAPVEEAPVQAPKNNKFSL